METTASESVRPCPFCAEEILFAARKCKHCGEWLAELERNTGSYGVGERIAAAKVAATEKRAKKSGAANGCAAGCLALVGLLVVVVLIGAMSSDNSAATQHIQSLAAPTAATDSRKAVEHAEAKPAAAPRWHIIHRWKGEGIRNTQTFHIPNNDWRISWATRPGEVEGNFQIYVYRADGSMADVAANVIGSNRDESFMHDGGDYYLQINSSQPWVIVVDALY